MRSMQWQLGVLGTISAFTYRQGNQEKPVPRWQFCTPSLDGSQWSALHPGYYAWGKELPAAVE